MSYCNASFIKFDFLIFVCGHKHCILRVGITMTKNVYLGYPRTPTIEKAENISFQECVDPMILPFILSRFYGLI